MTFIIKDEAPPREPIPLGMQQAVCAFVEDIGYEPNKLKNGALTHKLVILWELAEKMADGRPFMVSKKYTVSLNEKSNLRKDLESWRSKKFTAEELAGFDLHKLVGVNCLLNLVENTVEATGKKYTNIQSISPVMKGMPKLEVETEDLPEWVTKLRDLALQDAARKTVDPAKDPAPATTVQPDGAVTDEPPF